MKWAVRVVGDALDSVSSSDGGMRTGVAGAVKTGGEAVADSSRAVGHELRKVREFIGAAADVTREQFGTQSERKASQGGAASAKWIQVAGQVAIDAVETAGKAVAGIGELSAHGVSAAGRAAATHSQTVGSAAAGVVKGTAMMLGGAADSVGISDADIDALRLEIARARMGAVAQRELYQRDLKTSRPRCRGTVSEQLTIGGLLLADILASGHVPHEIAAAYSAAYPVESQAVDFLDKVASLDSGQQLEGLLNGVKGKLFEQQYLADLNDGLLADGSHAALAASATQPGWDIVVTDVHGHIQKELSLKATEHVAYVQDALERYPDIDVVSTSEVYGALAGTPEGVHLIDGGIDNADLAQAVHSAAVGGSNTLDYAALSIAALLPAAYKHFSAPDKTAEEKVTGFAQHVGRAKSAVVIGHAAMMAVPYWPVAVLASTGMSLLARVGNNRREQLTRMQALLGAIRKASAGLLERRKAMELHRR